MTAFAEPVAEQEAPRAAGRYRPSPHSLANRIARLVWGWVWLVAFRPTPKVCHGWRRWLLRRFGATLAPGVTVHASARVWAPWNLSMGRCSSLAPGVDCYSVAPIRIGAYVSVSQGAFLCAASHDIDSPDMTLTYAPITIDDHAWIAADAFVAPGLHIGEGAVVGARAAVFKSVPPWTVVGGNPARVLRQRSRAVAGNPHAMKA
jgi:putative colanic acid biosynthesis acetyltransferase WcaF